MTVPGITKQLKLSKCSALLRVLACICLASAWEHTTSFVLIFLNYSILALAVHFVLCQTLLAHDSAYECDGAYAMTHHSVTWRLLA